MTTELGEVVTKSIRVEVEFSSKQLQVEVERVSNQTTQAKSSIFCALPIVFK